MTEPDSTPAPDTTDATDAAPDAAPSAEVNVNVGETSVPDAPDTTAPVADPENPPSSTADAPTSDAVPEES